MAGKLTVRDLMEAHSIHERRGEVEAPRAEERKQAELYEVSILMKPDEVEIVDGFILYRKEVVAVSRNDAVWQCGIKTNTR